MGGTTPIRHPLQTRPSPSYPDNRQSINEAEAAVRTIVEKFFDEHVPAWCTVRDAAKAEKAEARKAAQAHDDQTETEPEEADLDSNADPHTPQPTSWGVRIE